ncbi:MAG: GDSL-type esterase/lipase family protein [Micrococcales bacterium]|nr:GDSL-type esterase/lipase family protein [Micrococcales bacterium]
MRRVGASRDERGGAAVEYVGVTLVVAVILGAVILVAPSLGGTVGCAVQRAFSSITGSSAPVCASGVDTATPDDGPATSEVVLAVYPEGDISDGSADSRTSTGVLRVEAGEDVTWTVTSDQSWAIPSVDQDRGPGEVDVTFRSNPGQDREATITITSSDGQTVTQTITQPGETQTYVALGDSYSAGVGAYPRSPGDRVTGALIGGGIAGLPGALIGGGVGTDFDESERRERSWWPDAWNEDECYRAALGWPRLLGNGQTTASGTPSLRMATDSFVACTGATSDGTSMTGGTAPSVMDQIDQARDTLGEAGIVSISIGGNDIGFAEVVTECVTPFKSPADCSAAIRLGNERIADTSEDGLNMRLVRTYEAMLEAAPNATIYVVGYPPVIEHDDTGRDPWEPWNVGKVYNENVAEAAELIQNLNRLISDTVDEVNAASPTGPRLVFVDPGAPGSPFIGHSVNDPDPYTNGLTLPPVPYSYHPNVAGNEAYARWVAEHMLGAR